MIIENQYGGAYFRCSNFQRYEGSRTV